MDFKKNAPTFLLIGSAISEIASIVTAITATPKAERLIEEYKMQNGVVTLTVAETVKVSWKEYIPSFLLSVCSIVLAIGANSVTEKRAAALTAALGIAEETYKKYKEKTESIVPKEKIDSIQKEIVDDQIASVPFDISNAIYTGHGSTLCFDPMSGRLFYSDRNFIDRVVNDVNRHNLTDCYMYTSLNEFYDMIELPMISLGTIVGFNIDHPLEITYTTTLAPDGCTPCLVLNYLVDPKYKYDSDFKYG